MKRVDPKGECCGSCRHREDVRYIGCACSEYTKTRFDPKSTGKGWGWHVIPEDGMWWRKCSNYSVHSWNKNRILKAIREGREEEDLDF